MDIGGQHGRRFALLRHTHRPQRKPYSICTSRSRKSDTGAEAVKQDLLFSWASHYSFLGRVITLFLGESFDIFDAMVFSACLSCSAGLR